MNDYMELLGNGFNNHVATREKRPGVTKLIAPLFHEDGDMLDIFLEELDDNRIRVSDKGLSLMRLSYSFDIDTPNKDRIFRQILVENKIEEDEGNIYFDVEKKNIYPAVLHFGQTVAKVTNMSLYRRDDMTLIILDHIEPSDYLSDLYDKMSDEATQWNKAYRESGKRGAELSESDIAFSVANLHAANREQFIFGEIRNGGLQLRKGNEKNAMAWWYADGSNVEGADLESLHAEIERRMNIKETTR